MPIESQTCLSPTCPCGSQEYPRQQGRGRLRGRRAFLLLRQINMIFVLVVIIDHRDHRDHDGHCDHGVQRAHGDHSDRGGHLDLRSIPKISNSPVLATTTQQSVSHLDLVELSCMNFV